MNSFVNRVTGIMWILPKYMWLLSTMDWRFLSNTLTLGVLVSIIIDLKKCFSMIIIFAV